MPLLLQWLRWFRINAATCSPLPTRVTVDLSLEDFHYQPLCASLSRPETFGHVFQDLTKLGGTSGYEVLVGKRIPHGAPYHMYR